MNRRSGEQNMIELIKKLKFKWISLEILKFLAEEYSFFSQFTLYHTCKRQTLKIWLHLIPKCVKMRYIKKKTTTKDFFILSRYI